MRDGIYSFHVTSNGTTLNGIAMIQNDSIRGLTSGNVFPVERIRRYKKPCWHVYACRYANREQSTYGWGFPAIVAGEDREDSFALDGAADGDANVKISIHGKWLLDLPWPL
jgi:hypothetical protein